MAAARSAAGDSNLELPSLLKESVETPKRAAKLRRGLNDSAKLENARLENMSNKISVNEI